MMNSHLEKEQEFLNHAIDTEDHPLRIKHFVAALAEFKKIN